MMKFAPLSMTPSGDGKPLMSAKHPSYPDGPQLTGRSLFLFDVLTLPGDPTWYIWREYVNELVDEEIVCVGFRDTTTGHFGQWTDDAS